MNSIKIVPAKREQAEEIASLIMEAMDYDCCQNLAGPNHSLEDFHKTMTDLVRMEDSQYSFKNTLVAVASLKNKNASLKNKEERIKNTEDAQTPISYLLNPNSSNIAGCIVGYDGKDLRRLRQRFIEKAKEDFGIDYSDMDDETKEGEYYIDSLCVKKEYRKHGIATDLLLEAIRRNGSQPVGLLVDHTHPWAERLYKRIGFEFVNETTWGGHAMNHLQFAPRPQWALRDNLSLSYYDNEWCVPCHDDNEIFMYLIMETMSCGLSWHLMLQKRESFRNCFAGFDPQKVAEFTNEDIDRIIDIEGMIRSPRKIKAMINNAQRFVNIQKEYGSFDKYIWSFTDGKTMDYPEHRNKMIARNDLSDKVAKDMKKRGFKYVGSIIVYSFLQAVGIVNDR